MRKLTNANLRSMFRRLNKRYWDGNIFEPRIIEFKPLRDEDGFCICVRDDLPRVIRVDSELRGHERVVELTMLHEMAHLFLGPEQVTSHGLRFNAEIDRLYKIGAYDNLL